MLDIQIYRQLLVVVAHDLSLETRLVEILHFSLYSQHEEYLTLEGYCLANMGISMIGN